jgi:ribA/ribD-fused uncharacterized protein
MQDQRLESQEEPINFYDVDKEYGCFSNFSRHPITLEGKVWPTSEHYFQAKKFEGTEHEEEVRWAPVPKAAAQMGRERHRPLRKDWEEVKEAIMMTALRAKFTQNVGPRNVLLSTGNHPLVEHTKNDGYWGDNGDGTGKNRLGVLLVQLRNELRKGG